MRGSDYLVLGVVIGVAWMVFWTAVLPALLNRPGWDGVPPADTEPWTGKEDLI